MTKEEWKELITNCDNLGNLKFSPSPPFAFTEHGTVMLATILNSPQASQASIFVVRAFVKMREFFAVQQEFSKQLEELREKINDLEARHGEQFRQVFAALRQLIQTEDHPPQKRQPIGFKNNKN